MVFELEVNQNIPYRKPPTSNNSIVGISLGENQRLDDEYPFPSISIIFP